MYTRKTRDIKITVDPFYADEHSVPDENKYVFGYTVTVENEGEDKVQLVSRHWRIIDGLGRQSEVRGEGVVGEQPVIEPGDQFTYTSGAPIPTPSGFMSGTYQMIDRDGRWFDAEIPLFALDAPFVPRITN